MTLADLGFQSVQEGRDGTRRYARRSNRYLVHWLTVYASGEADLTWEFSLGEFLRDQGFFVSAQDALSLLLFPPTETRGTGDPQWVAKAVSDAEDALRALDFVAG